LFLVDQIECVSCRMSISSKGGSGSNGARSGGGLSGQEPGLVGSLNSLAAEEGSHRREERDQACRVGLHHDNDDRGEGTKKGHRE
jgi:hypothetical protein